MAQVVVAECGDRMWVVLGDEHVGLLLLGELPPEIEVEMVRCDSPAEAIAMWQDLSPDATQGGVPWAINPLLAQRIRAAAGRAEWTLQFGPWSAALDTGATGVVDAAAAWLRDNPGRQLVLRQFELSPVLPGQAEIRGVRGQLVLGALQQAGADAARCQLTTAAAAGPDDADRMVIEPEAA